MVIPAHPLALKEDKSLDESHQRALSRYYLDCGVGGLAVGVHTTEFAIHDPKVGLYRPVWNWPWRLLAPGNLSPLFPLIP